MCPLLRISSYFEMCEEHPNSSSHVPSENKSPDIVALETSEVGSQAGQPTTQVPVTRTMWLCAYVPDGW